MKGIDFQEPVGDLILDEEVLGDFIVRSKSGTDKGLDDLVAEIEEYRREGKVWEIFCEGVKEGIFWAKVVNDSKGDPVLNVGGVYIRPGARDRQIISGIDKTLGGYARECGVKKIAFHTRRDGESFRRYLRNGWVIDSIVMSRNAE